VIEDFMTAYWGKLPLTDKPYPVHPKVNAFVGQSGHGKTTIMDGIRTALGESTFETNRGIGYYVNKKSTWAIVRVGFYNRQIDNRVGMDAKKPFEMYGYRQDKVVVCCRIFKNSEGRWNKEYYVFDGEFIDLKGLAENPKAYKQAIKTQENYRQMLEDCIGLSASFRRLMSMDPHSVRDLVDKSPAALYQQIYELKGVKDIKNRYEDAKQRLSVQKKDYETLKEELEAAKSRYADLGAKVELYQQHKCKVTQKERLDVMRAKVVFAETEEVIDKLKSEIKSATDEIQQLETEINQSKILIQECDSKIAKLTEAAEAASKLINSLNAECDLFTVQMTEKNVVLRNMSKDIERIAKIQPISIEDLKEELDTVTRQCNALLVETVRLKNAIQAIESDLKRLGRNNVLFPPFVDKYREQLTKANIEFTMLADAISIKGQHKDWQRAIEAFLGRERYRIVVSQNDFLMAKKLQQSAQYGARVCLPKAPREAALKSQGKLLSIYDAIEVKEKQIIDGYLEHLKKVYLVHTVEEGDQLQKRGLVSITIQGLQQDNDGAIFRHIDVLCCGKSALKMEKSRLENEMEVLKSELGSQESMLADSKITVNTYAVWIKEQEEYQTLESLQVKADLLQSEIDAVSASLITAKEQRAETDKVRVAAFQEVGNAQAEKAAMETQTKASANLITNVKRRLRSNETDLDQNKVKLGMFRQALIDFGINDDNILFIPQDLAGADYNDDQGNRISSIYFESEAKKLDSEIKEFVAKHKDIDDTTVQLYTAQDGIVESQEKRLKANEDLRVEVEEETQNCLYALTRHIKDIIKDYIDEFNVLAGLLRAEGKGRLESITDDPAFWELQMFIGFDGKKPAPINGPDLSQGQRSCTSLMLLLAAISNRKNGGLMPIMFLDEPRSRLDDDRGNEVGWLLQVTDVQYFITHQQGESLKTVDWINHAYTCIKCGEDELFTQPMILKRMRTV